MMTDDATGRSTQRAMMMRDMTGNAAYHRALDATFGFGGSRQAGKRKRQNRTAQDRFHWPQFLHGDC